MRPLLSLLFYLLLMEDVIFAADKTYCNPRKSLTTDLVIPTYEETRPVKGCVAKQGSLPKRVVVIRAKTAQTLPESEILLTLTDPQPDDEEANGGVLLVLDSSSPLTWKLSFHPKVYKFQVVLSPGSILGSSEGAEVLKYKNLATEMTDEKFGTLVEQNYGPVALMAIVENANRISVSLPSTTSSPPSPSSSKCSFNSFESIPDSAVAFLVEKQKMYGCYHAERAGSMTTDLLVIDLILNTYDHDSNIPVVFLSMTPSPQGQDLDTSPRNLTLVLNSNRQVRWYLESWKMIGTLQVISSNGLVENHALSPGQSLQIIRKRLPEDYGQLWRSVIAETGVAPISYVKVNEANVISLLIPPRKVGKTVTTQEMTSNYAPDRVSLHDAPIAGHEDLAINMQVPKKTNLAEGISRQMSKFSKSTSNFGRIS